MDGPSVLNPAVSAVSLPLHEHRPQQWPQVLRTTLPIGTPTDLAPPEVVGERRGTGSQNAKCAEQRRTMCLVVGGVVRDPARPQSHARQSTAPRQPATVPTGGASRAGPGDRPAARVRAPTWRRNGLAVGQLSGDCWARTQRLTCTALFDRNNCPRVRSGCQTQIPLVYSLTFSAESLLAIAR